MKSALSFLRRECSREGRERGSFCEALSPIVNVVDSSERRLGFHPSEERVRQINRGWHKSLFAIYTGVKRRASHRGHGGHRGELYSKSMSAHYTHVGAEALEKAVAALPEIQAYNSSISG